MLPNPSVRGLASPIILAQASAGAAPNAEDWAAFKRRYLAPDGRVVDTANGGISHSEGQSYGMLFAVHFNERQTFDLMWEWTARNLRRPSDYLSAWKYVPRSPMPVPDNNNATDGDLVLAWALLRAASKWGDTRYVDPAQRIARAVLGACSTEFGGRQVLLPGARGFQRGDKVVVNPSYFAFGAFRALSRLVPDAKWAALETSSLEILRASALGRWNLPPDWCEISQNGSMRPAADWPPRYSWDAVRVPVHLAWAGLREPAVEAAAKFYFDQSHPYRPPAWVDLYRNTIAPYPGHAGIMAVAQLAAQRSGINAQYRRIPIAEAPDYYGASLIIIAGLAAAEQPEAPPLVPQAAQRTAQQGGGGAVRTALRYLGLGANEPPPPPPQQVAGLSPLARLGGRNAYR